MNCIKCHREATPNLKFNKVTYYICEHCGKSFSICDNGQASQREIDDLQKEQMRQIIRYNRYKPLRLQISASLKSRNGNTRMYDPKADREAGFTSECHLRARG